MLELTPHKEMRAIHGQCMDTHARSNVLLPRRIGRAIAASAQFGQIDSDRPSHAGKTAADEKIRPFHRQGEDAIVIQ